MPAASSPSSRALLILGTAAAALSLLDPNLSGARAIGPLLALLGAAAAWRTGGRWPAFAVLLSCGCALAALVQPEFRGDAPGYYAYLRSLFFDHDLDFANEMRAWGL